MATNQNFAEKRFHRTKVHTSTRVHCYFLMPQPTALYDAQDKINQEILVQGKLPMASLSLPFSSSPSSPHQHHHQNLFVLIMIASLHNGFIILYTIAQHLEQSKVLEISILFLFV